MTLADEIVATPVEAAQDLRLLCLLPSIPLGGMERAALRVVQQLMQRGAAVHVLAERRWGGAVQREVEAIGAGWSGVDLPASLSRPRTSLEAWTALVSLAATGRQFDRARRAFRANAVLATNVNNAYFARHIARRAEVRSAFRVPNPPPPDDGGIGARMRRNVWRTVHASFDHLVCNCEYTAARVAQTVGTTEKIRVLRNFPPRLDRRIERPAPPLAAGRRHVVYVGQISEGKGVSVLVEAARTVLAARDGVDFVLAGSGLWRDDYAGALEARLAAEGLGERVRLVGQVDDVHGLLRQAAIHVCPSISAGDSFPNVILDAKQAGAPSVVFPVAGLPEAVEPGVDGLVTPEPTADALARAILALLENEAERARMGSAARASLRRHEPERLAAEWIGLLGGGA